MRAVWLKDEEKLGKPTHKANKYWMTEKIHVLVDERKIHISKENKTGNEKGQEKLDGRVV